MRLEIDRALSGRAAVLLCAVVLAASILPVLVVRHPPLHDYPEHIARCTILAHWADWPLLHRFYEMGSFVIPNVGVDLAVPLLARAMPVETAGRVFLCVVLALQLGGIAALHRVLHGRVSAWPILAGGLLLYNWIFLFCLLNYLVGLGLLLWSLAGWLLLRERSPVWLALGGAGLALLLFFAHLVAFGLFALLVAAWELRAAAGRWSQAPGRALGGLFAAALPFAAPVILFVSVSRISEELERRVVYEPFWSWKPAVLLRALSSGHPGFDVAYAAGVAVCLALLAWAGRLRLAPGAWLLVAVAAAAYLALPAVLMEAYYVDARIPVALAMLGVAGTRLRFDAARWGAVVLVVLASLLVVRTAVFTRSWVRHDAVIQDIVDGLGALPEGSVLFSAEAFAGSERPDMASRMLDPGPGYRRWQPPLEHVASLAVLEKPVFVPATWASPTQQPLGVTAPYLDLYAIQRRGPFRVASPLGLSRVIARIRASYAKRPGERGPPYLLLVEGGGALRPRDDEASVVREGERFVLVRLRVPGALTGP